MTMRVRLLLLLAQLALLFGCTATENPVSDTTQPPPTAADNDHTSRTPATIIQPKPDRPNADSSASISWEQEVRRMSEDKAAYLDSINNRYFGAVAYENEQERRYLEESGFPSIDEWLQARTMSDNQLQQWASSGDGKAMAFYIDRMLERATPYLHLRGVDDTAYKASPAASYALKAYEFSTQVQSTHKSPFSGYLLGAMFSTLAYSQSPESAAAGIMAARDAGDPRASALLLTYEANHPGMDQQAILAARRAMEISR